MATSATATIKLIAATEAPAEISGAALPVAVNPDSSPVEAAFWAASTFRNMSAACCGKVGGPGSEASDWAADLVMRRSNFNVEGRFAPMLLLIRSRPARNDYMPHPCHLAMKHGPSYTACSLADGVNIRLRLHDFN